MTSNTPRADMHLRRLCEAWRVKPCGIGQNVQNLLDEIASLERELNAAQAEIDALRQPVPAGLREMLCIPSAEPVTDAEVDALLEETDSDPRIIHLLDAAQIVSIIRRLRARPGRQAA